MSDAHESDHNKATAFKAITVKSDSQGSDRCLKTGAFIIIRDKIKYSILNYRHSRKENLKEATRLFKSVKRAALMRL